MGAIETLHLLGEKPVPNLHYRRVAGQLLGREGEARLARHFPGGIRRELQRAARARGLPPG